MAETGNKSRPDTPRSVGYLDNRGMSIKHAAEIGEYNKTSSWLMVFRPINSDVAKKLDEGYKGKVIFIKSKSSEFPPIAEDIPFEAELSKSFNKGRDTIDHFNRVAEDAIKNSKDNIAKKKEEVEKHRTALEAKKQELKKLKALEAKLMSGQQKLEADKIELENGKQELTNSQQELEKLRILETELMSSQQELEAEIKKDEENLRYIIEEYNLNFFLDTKPKTVEIPGENNEFELYYRKTVENGHNVEVDKDKPVFYIKKSDNKYYKITDYTMVILFHVHMN